jgi:cellulose synthase/poly-beta-1,6-N-acetylglucosamine synthase-like glycosyltransferase
MVAWIFLLTGSLIVFYVLIGYPVLLAFGFRKAAPAIQKDLTYRPPVSILLAVHNGEDFIRRKLDTLLALDYPADRLEILVISDGSTDATEPIVQSFAGRGVRLLAIPRSGKAAALNAGLAHATGDILFFTDVRQIIPPQSLAQLVANLADGTVGAVTGEPHFVNARATGEEADMELYWRYELWARRRHSAILSACNTTGWVYATRRSLAEPLPPDTLVDDAVLPLRVLCRGYRVAVEPLAPAFDFPRIQGGEFRRKLRTLAGLWQVHARMPGLFSGSNRMRFHFFSHKTMRLLLPWGIVMIWAAALALPPSALQRLLAIDPLILAAIAWLDLLVPRNFAFRRISSPVRSFLAMNLAALLSPVVFLVEPGVLWRPTRLAAEVAGTVERRPDILKLQP